MLLKSINSSRELFIQRHANGIKLSENVREKHVVSLNKMFAMPFNVYFLDTKGVVEAVNEAVPKSFNLLSVEDAVGITVYDCAKKDCGDFSMEHNVEVIKEKSIIIKDESYVRLDDVFFSMMTIKYPWYDNNCLRGIFGISIISDKQLGSSLADSMSLLMGTGLLNENNPKLPGLTYDGIYLTEREKEISFHLIRGKSAKNIAHILKRSPRTIEHHIENMKIKLNCISKADLIEKMISHLIQD